MSGTKAGGIKARKTIKERHGKDFFKKIGKIGGENGRTGGFFGKKPCQCEEIPEPHHKAQCAGKKGGRISRKRKPTDDPLGS